MKFNEANKLADRITEIIVKTISKTPEDIKNAKEYFGDTTIAEMIDEAFEE